MGPLGAYVSRESIEGGIWILSVLFCSCVCFGNIGRRLALSGSGVWKERIAGAHSRAKSIGNSKGTKAVANGRR